MADLPAGLDDVPAYYAHMGPANARGPAPVDLTPPAPADAEEIAARLAAGEWVVDLRNRVAFAEGHVAGSVNFESEGQLATYLAWLLPWGKPVTLLAESPRQLADAQRELVRVGIDRPAAAATGSPADWLRAGERARSFPRAAFADLAKVHGVEGTVALDVRRASERATGHIAGSVHIPVHQLRDRLAEIPGGTVWVHRAGGMRAAIATSLLDAAGRDVVAVDDGFAGAAEAGLPMAGPTEARSHGTGTAGSSEARTAGSTDARTAPATRTPGPRTTPTAGPTQAGTAPATRSSGPRARPTGGSTEAGTALAAPSPNPHTTPTAGPTEARTALATGTSGPRTTPAAGPTEASVGSPTGCAKGRTSPAGDAALAAPASSGVTGG